MSWCTKTEFPPSMVIERQAIYSHQTWLTMSVSASQVVTCSCTLGDPELSLDQLWCPANPNLSSSCLQSHPRGASIGILVKCQHRLHLGGLSTWRPAALRSELLTLLLRLSVATPQRRLLSAARICRRILSVTARHYSWRLEWRLPGKLWFSPLTQHSLWPVQTKIAWTPQLGAVNQAFSGSDTWPEN